jgi:hypothetical protein
VISSVEVVELQVNEVPVGMILVNGVMVCVIAYANGVANVKVVDTQSDESKEAAPPPEPVPQKPRTCKV